jgi:geranylgeranyl diphosphate synthase type II
MVAVPSFFAQYQRLVDDGLAGVVPRAAPGPVADAMRYTLLAPAKRVRAVLVMLSAELCGSAAHALPAACAIEAIHTASLMLDDLPSMDDAPLRRGRPSAHVAFGEAITILAAFGLLSESYGLVVRRYEPPLAREIASVLAEAVGLDGLIAGQAEDVTSGEAPLTFESLERIHRRKTGVLFSAAATAGALSAGGTHADIAALTAYARNLGLAFQIVDDLLDVIGTPEDTGKAARRDVRKTTFVSFSGVDGARELAGELCRTATAALAPFGRRGARLAELAEFVAARRG